MHVFGRCEEAIVLWGNPHNHANSTQKDPNPESSLGSSCCEVTLLTTAPPLTTQWTTSSYIGMRRLLSQTSEHHNFVTKNLSKYLFLIISMIGCIKHDRNDLLSEVFLSSVDVLLANRKERVGFMTFTAVMLSILLYCIVHTIRFHSSLIVLSVFCWFLIHR